MHMLKSLLPDIVLDIKFACQQFKSVHGHYPNLLNPKSFNEKVVHRSLFDNRPILKTLADKFAMREFVAKRIGDAFLPEMYHCTENPDDIPFQDFPTRYVVKPTHGSGWVKVVKDKTKVNTAELTEQCHSWLSEDYYERCRERVYRNIIPRIMVEEYIDDGLDGGPADYKFAVFHGRVAFVNVIYDRFGSLRGLLLDRNWTPMNPQFAADLMNDSTPAPAGPPPPHYSEMREIAEKLGAEFDFIRVDLYSTPDRIYVGELTTTPGAGLDPFHPKSFDRELGALW